MNLIQRIKNLWALSEVPQTNKHISVSNEKEAIFVSNGTEIWIEPKKATFIPRHKRDPVKEITESE